MVFDFGRSVIYAFGLDFRIFALGAMVEVKSGRQKYTLPLSALEARAFFGLVSETGISRVVIRENPLSPILFPLRFNLDNITFFIFGRQCRRKLFLSCKN